MHNLNLIWVFNPTADKVLMCKRHKEPYMGLYNLVGGKVEPGEAGLTAAYRELAEETGITDITLHHLADFTYYYNGFHIAVYCGKLGHAVEVSGDEKELAWIDTTENFFDISRFAGDGNLGHIFALFKYAGEKYTGQAPKLKEATAW